MAFLHLNSRTQGLANFWIRIKRKPSQANPQHMNPRTSIPRLILSSILSLPIPHSPINKTKFQLTITTFSQTNSPKSQLTPVSSIARIAWLKSLFPSAKLFVAVCEPKATVEVQLFGAGVCVIVMSTVLVTATLKPSPQGRFGLLC